MMNAAISRLKEKLLSEHTPEELGVVLESETVVASFNENRVGGLRYLATKTTESTERPVSVEVIHDQLDRFHIYVYAGEMEASDLETRVATVVPFQTVNLEVKRLLSLVSES